MKLKNGDIRKFIIKKGNEEIGILGVYENTCYENILLVTGEYIGVSYLNIVDVIVTRLPQDERSALKKLSDKVIEFGNVKKKSKEDTKYLSEVDRAYSDMLGTHVKVALMFNQKYDKGVNNESIDYRIGEIVDIINDGENYTYTDLAKKILTTAKLGSLTKLELSNIVVTGTELYFNDEVSTLFFNTYLKCECNKLDVCAWVRIVENKAKFKAGNLNTTISFEAKKGSKRPYIECGLHCKLGKGFLTLNEKLRLDLIKNILKDFNIVV